jgi:hypothetical protein
VHFNISNNLEKDIESLKKVLNCIISEEFSFEAKDKDSFIYKFIIAIASTSVGGFGVLGITSSHLAKLKYLIRCCTMLELKKGNTDALEWIKEGPNSITIVTQELGGIASAIHSQAQVPSITFPSMGNFQVYTSF